MRIHCLVTLEFFVVLFVLCIYVSFIYLCALGCVFVYLCEYRVCMQLGVISPIGKVGRDCKLQCADKSQLLWKNTVCS